MLVIGLLAIVRMAGRPAGPHLDGVLLDTVVLSPMLREVRGAGNLAPVRTYFVTATSSARVEQLLTESGAHVEAGTSIVRLANPDVQVEALLADQQLSNARTQLLDTESASRMQRLTVLGTIAELETRALEAQQETMAADTLVHQGYMSPLEATRVRARSQELATRLRLEHQRLTVLDSSTADRRAGLTEQVRRLEEISTYRHRRLAGLLVATPAAGVVQDFSVQPGQWVTEGTTLAKVMQPDVLKAVLRIPEAQAKDVVAGQRVRIDLQTASVHGEVSRKDPAAQSGAVVVDVTITEPLPDGAVPDLVVDGIIEIERTAPVLHVGRPIQATGSRTISVFRLHADGRSAERVQLEVGRMSATDIEVVRGLNNGDVIILSDISRVGDAERITIN